MSAEQMLTALFGGIALASGVMAALGLTINLISRTWGVQPLSVRVYAGVCTVATLVWANLEGLM